MPGSDDGEIVIEIGATGDGPITVGFRDVIVAVWRNRRFRASRGERARFTRPRGSGGV